MSRYLDPKSDLVFTKIFGQHPKLLKSFLNAVLPLPEHSLIDSLVYLPREQAPQIPAFKYSIVDVKCTDQQGRIFIVEMQVQWTKSFIQRLLFGTSTAYVRQLERGEQYDLLKPVYGLGLLNDVFDRESSEWYHHYKLVNVKDTQRDIKDLQLIFIELPKFHSTSMSHRKLQILWLRFLSELNEKTKQVPAEWLSVPEIRQAVELTEESAYSASEMEAYDKYWDIVSTEKTLLHDKFEEGLEQGIKQGVAQGRLDTKQVVARNLLNLGLSVDEIVIATGLSISEIHQLK